jgi:hypothetical protein
LTSAKLVRVPKSGFGVEADLLENIRNALITFFGR